MKVIKLGNISQCLIEYDRLIKLINNIIENKENDEKIVIVLSAATDVTNLLEKFLQTKDKKYIDKAILINYNLIQSLKGYDILDNIPKFMSLFSNLIKLALRYLEYDDIHLKAQIIGYGEIMSTNIFYLSYNLDKISDIKLGNSYDYIKSKKETSKLYLSDDFEFYCSNKINDYMNNCKILITQENIASTPNYKHIILGRDTNYTTGSLIANKLKADEYQIWS